MFKAPAIINFSISQLDRWWNKGNEFKPNKVEFDAIGWSVLDVKYVNSFVWKNSFSASMVIEEEYKNRMFKIDTKQRSYYFYVENVIDRLPTKNGNILYECELSLDIWCTYILNLEIPVYSNRYNGNWEYPQNVIKGFLKNDNPLIDLKQSRCQIVNFKNNGWSKIKVNPNYNGSPVYEKLRYTNLIRYYVFREKKTPTMFSGNNNITLIPVLFDLSGTKKVQKLDQLTFNDLKYYVEPDNSGTKPYKLYLMNDERNLNNLVDFKLNYDVSALGEFVGCFVGVNFFRTKPFKESWVLGLIGSVSVHTNIAQCVPIIRDGNSSSIGGFWCLKIGNKWSDITSYQGSDFVEEAIKFGLYPLGDDKATTTILKNKLVFTDKFVYANEYDTYSNNTEIPTFTDTYWDWLAKSKPARDTSFNIAAQQLGFSLANNLMTTTFDAGHFFRKRKFYKKVTENNALKYKLNNTSMFVDDSKNFISATAQFMNFWKQQETEKQTQRLNHNSQINSTDVNFLLNWNQLNETLLLSGLNYPQPDITTNNLDTRAYELFVGTKKVSLANTYNFYGWETGWYEIENKKIKDIVSGYLIWPESVNMLFAFNSLTNEEKTVIVELLTNGVRVGLKSEVENDFN